MFLKNYFFYFCLTFMYTYHGIHGQDLATMDKEMLKKKCEQERGSIACQKMIFCNWISDKCLLADCADKWLKDKPNCQKDNACVWSETEHICVNNKINSIYKGIKTDWNIEFDRNSRCYTRRKQLTAKIEESSPVPKCFKEFHDEALLPICGHPLYDLFKYCLVAKFYDNKSYADFVKGNYMLLLMDGCMFCKEKEYFANNKVEIKFEVETVNGVGFDIDKEGNFMLKFHVYYMNSPRNVSIVFEHRCNRDHLLQYKVINFVVQAAEAYPLRVWESKKTAIALDGDINEMVVEQEFTSLRGKSDD